MKVSCTELLKKLDERYITLDEITNQANVYLEENNLTDAYPYVKATALSSQNSIFDKMTAGVLAVTLQKDEQAVEMFKAVLAQDENNYDASYNLALIEIKNENFVDAYKKLQTLLEMYPEKTELLNDLAVVATYLKKSKKAFQHWRSALRTNPNDGMSRNNALVYSLENNFFKEANQLLTANLKSKQNDDKSIAEINRWQEIVEEKKNETRNSELTEV